MQNLTDEQLFNESPAQLQMRVLRDMTAILKDPSTTLSHKLDEVEWRSALLNELM